MMLGDKGGGNGGAGDVGESGGGDARLEDVAGG